MRVIRSVSIVLLCALALPGNVYSTDTAQAIDAYLAGMNAQGRFNGAALVAVDDAVLLNKGFGYANLEWNEPNTADTRFNIGSIAKQFTTVMVFQLAAEGKLKLGDVISMYVPDYRKDIGGVVTIDQLLRHTSGIPCYLRDYQRTPDDDLLFPFPGATHFTRKTLLSHYMNGDLLFEPGTSYRYSNTGFYLLHLIVENVTGKSYEENLRTRILEPLGLKQTGLLDNAKIIEHLANGYVDTPAGMIRSRTFYERNYYGAGGIYSTTGDLLVWSRALRSGPFLSAETRKKMSTPYWGEGGPIQYAYSLNYFTWRRPGASEPVRYSSFDGAIQGFISDVFHFEDDGITIVILDNSDQFNHNRIARDIYSLLNNSAVPAPKPPLSRHIARIAIDKGIDEAVSAYYGILDGDAGDLDVGPVSGGLSFAALTLADAGMNREAGTILELNRRINPHFVRVYDDIADFLEHRGAPGAAGAKKTAQRVRETEEALYRSIETGEFGEAMKVVEAARNEWPRADVFEPNRIGPIFGELYGRERYGEAIEVCRVWAAGNHRDVGPYFSMARVYEKTGKKSEARRCYATIMEISRDEALRRRAEERLRALEKE